MNSYWGSNGKHQKELNKLNDLVPDWGMTENKYMNLFILASNIYYDVYNNGGGNLKENYPDRIEKYLVPFEKELKSLRLNVKIDTLIKNFKNLEKLEKFLDEIILYLEDKDLNYHQYYVYFNNNLRKLSHVEQEDEDFHKITFGIESEYKEWVKFREETWKFKFIG